VLKFSPPQTRRKRSRRKRLYISKQGHLKSGFARRTERFGSIFERRRPFVKAQSSARNFYRRLTSPDFVSPDAVDVFRVIEKVRRNHAIEANEAIGANFQSLLQMRAHFLNEDWRSTPSRCYPGKEKTCEGGVAPRFSRSPTSRSRPVDAATRSFRETTPAAAALHRARM
jgi:hypothetical protein